MINTVKNLNNMVLPFLTAIFFPDYGYQGIPWDLYLLHFFFFAIVVPFHVIILLSVNIGMFSWVMIAVLMLLVSSSDFNCLKTIMKRMFKRKYIVFYDRDCGFCHLTARILRRMDGFSRLTWSDKLQKGEKPKNLNTLLETTIVVWDPKTDEI